jgi:hypothetical protein
MEVRPHGESGAGGPTVGQTSSSCSAAPQGQSDAQNIGASGQSATHQIHSAWGSLAQLPLKAGSVVVAISSGAEIELKEVNVYPHLEEEKERDAGTWVLDIGVTNHMSRC